MDSIGIFAIASRQAEHLSVRQSAIASNIANANVSTYKATDTISFADALANAAGAMAATNGKHFGAQGSSTQYQAHSTEQAVSLETELVKSAEVRSAMELNTGVVKSFHRMLLMTVKA